MSDGSTAATQQRTPRPPDLTRRQLRGTLVAAAIALAVGSVWVAKPLVIGRDASWAIAGTANAGHVVLITAGTRGQCERFVPRLIDETPRETITIGMKIKNRLCLGGSDLSAISGESFRIQLHGAINGRTIQGPKRFALDSAIPTSLPPRPQTAPDVTGLSPRQATAVWFALAATPTVQGPAGPSAIATQTPRPGTAVQDLQQTSVVLTARASR